MEVEIKDTGEVLNVMANIEGDGIYSITVRFLNGEVMVYAYDDKKKFTKDYSKLSSEYNRYITNGRRE